MNRTLSRDTPLTAAAALFSLGITVGTVAALTGASLSPPSLNGQSVGFFFIKNASVAVVLFLGGATVGIVTSLTLLFNGFVVGYAVAGTGDLLRSVVLLAPHGVVEFPAFLLAGAAGLQLPAELAAYLRGQQSVVVADGALRHAIVRFGVSILLLIIAAVLESVVTPLVGRLV